MKPTTSAPPSAPETGLFTLSEVASPDITISSRNLSHCSAIPTRTATHGPAPIPACCLVKTSARTRTAGWLSPNHPQVIPCSWQLTLLDAGALVGHLVAEGSLFAFLAEHRHELFSDGMFEDLFPSGKGRPSIPASVMASILVSQTLHDLSDRETAQAARCDLRWTNASSPRSPAAAADASNSPTAVTPRTTPGSNAAQPSSTSVTSSVVV